MKKTIKTLVLLSFAAVSGISMAQGVNHDSRKDNRQVDKMQHKLQRVDQASEHRQNEFHNMNGMMQQQAHSQRNRDRVIRPAHLSRTEQRRMHFAQVKHNQRSHSFYRSHHRNRFAR